MLPYNFEGFSNEPMKHIEAVCGQDTLVDISCRLLDSWTNTLKLGILIVLLHLYYISLQADKL